MEKKPQMLLIDPANELKFVGPFDQPSITTIKLTNPTDATQLFKIKTTAPKKYCVRPNVGAVKPNSNTLIDICLQPKSLEPNEKNRHKFMVQSFALPEGTQITDPAKMWQEVNPEELADTKLKCVFEMPGGGSAEQRFSGDKSNANDSAGSDKEVLVAPVAAPMPVKEDTPKEFFDKSNDNELRKARNENSSLKQENIKLQNEEIDQPIQVEPMPRASVSPEEPRKSLPPPEVRKSVPPPEPRQTYQPEVRKTLPPEQPDSRKSIPMPIASVSPEPETRKTLPLHEEPRRSIPMPYAAMPSEPARRSLSPDGEQARLTLQLPRTSLDPHSGKSGASPDILPPPKHIEPKHIRSKSTRTTLIQDPREGIPSAAKAPIGEGVIERLDVMSEDMNVLKNENRRLQEQILRLKLEEKKQAFTPPSAVQEVPMIYILMSIIAAIVGVILGKFLL
ncbi:VAPA family protein [Megaselia abdita]